MFALIVMLFFYLVGVINISDATNFAFTSASLLFSISAAVDTYAEKNKRVEIIRFIIDTFAIVIVVLIPNIKNSEMVFKMMEIFDTNVLLILALFFTMAGQWATEIKIIDLQKKMR